MLTDLDTVEPGLFGHCPQALLDIEESSAIAHPADPVIADGELGIATTDVVHSEPFERDAVLGGRFPRQEGVVVAGRRKLDRADPMEQPLAGQRLELHPEVVSAEDER